MWKPKNDFPLQHIPLGNLSWEAIPFLRNKSGVVCLVLFVWGCFLNRFTGTCFRSAVRPDCHHIVYTHLFTQMMGFTRAFYSTSEAGGWAAKLYFYFCQEGTVLAWLQQFTVNLEHGPRAGISANAWKWPWAIPGYQLNWPMEIWFGAPSWAPLAQPY